MQNHDKLTHLIEQAACSINMLGPADLAEMDDLHKTLDEIKKSLDQVTGAPVELLEQVKGNAETANDTLQKLLHNEVEDASSSINAVSNAIQSIQKLCDQMDKVQIVPADTKEETQSEIKVEPSVESEPQEGICIAEDDVSLVLDFVAESTEHLENAEAGLLELENKPDDSETLNLIFRGFHTIKGTAGFLNLTDISSLAHVAENLLDMARKGDLVMAGEYTDVIFESMDMLKKMIAGLKDAAENGRPVTSQKGLDALVARIEALAAGQTPSASALPTAGKGDARDALAGDEDRNDQTKDAGSGAKIIPSDEKIKVSTMRLDDLINMTGELVIAQSMVAEELHISAISDDSLARNVGHQGKIIRDLQELSMSMRMVPISSVFQKMARLVRDLSRKAGKNVNFSMSGEETELDRTIVDKIADPLVHMVRNSVDHGIESAEERKKVGKESAGKVELRAFHQAGNIVIEIEDDGNGLDKERILKKAISSGIVKEGQTLTDDEIYKLIFHAGLSTARKITSVSGRGVGMDVVRKNIESLRGKIDIDSRLGHGTVFTIRLPLTLAIIDGQLVKVGDDVFIVPINSIEQSLRPTPEQVSSVMDRGEMVMVRGELLPLVRLYELFDIRPLTEEPTDSLLVVVEEGNKRCCLLVDELLGQQQVVIKSLGNMLGRIMGVSGGAIMGDGRVRLILDIPGLMELAQD